MHRGLLALCFALLLINSNAQLGFTIDGVNDYDYSGWSVSMGGDVNGDGLGDISLGSAYAGDGYIIFGSKTPPPFYRYDLSSLDGKIGFKIEGATGSLTGWSMSLGGDLNGDKINDISIGAAHTSINGNPSAGQAYVIFGRNSTTPFAASFPLSSLNGANGFAIDGLASGANLGYSIAIGNDVNGDGLDDLIVGSPFLDTNGQTHSGGGYVIFGTTGSFSSTFDLTCLNGKNGFKINGGSAFQWLSAFSIGNDVNGDKIGDILIGPSVGSNGPAYLIFGKTSFPSQLNVSSLAGANGLVINGFQGAGPYSYIVSFNGDVNGDGNADILIGSPFSSSNADWSGQCYLIYGKKTFTSPLNVTTLNGSNGFLINGIAEQSRIGYSVTIGKDVNGDGVDDMLLNPGPYGLAQSFVIFGTKGENFPSPFDLNSLDGSNGFAINGTQYGVDSKYIASMGGDVNGDGIGDILIGNGMENAATNRGQSYLIYGRNTSHNPFPATVSLSNFNAIQVTLKNMTVEIGQHIVYPINQTVFTSKIQKPSKFEVVGLPSGLTFYNDTDLRVEGDATLTGEFPIKIVGSNEIGNVALEFVLIIVQKYYESSVSEGTIVGGIFSTVIRWAQKGQ